MKRRTTPIGLLTAASATKNSVDASPRRAGALTVSFQQRNKTVNGNISGRLMFAEHQPTANHLLFTPQTRGVRNGT